MCRRRPGACRRPPRWPPGRIHPGPRRTCRRSGRSRLPSPGDVSRTGRGRCAGRPSIPMAGCPSIPGHRCPVRRRTTTGSPRRARCRPHRSIPWRPRHRGGRADGATAPCRHPVVPWRRGWSTSPAKGASPRSTRSRSMATKSCSGTLRRGKSDGSTMGRRPSPARAASIAASVTRRHVLDVSAPTGAHTSG